ncbi:hypothetical protein A5767_07935 [Rhodococcus sp. 852002-51564_SCH6189132-a]|uniref:hypothetical protein n=1 Tax=Rhodococcus sp. 852002-51564_SCH6189132-a TaxID=1834103 RepID=UPI0007EB5FAF|nr:hypothetical protein [Rhodococcus sp. 852002-51564_SCH6189132-a]OBA36802.1 hypothetical protein A5767_07935 [Rhodococcus sp. 852002-51564_SCH6189132-a]
MRVRAAFPKLLVALTSSSLLLAGCSTAGSDTENDASDECITDFDASVDYFPDKSEIVDADFEAVVAQVADAPTWLVGGGVGGFTAGLAGLGRAGVVIAAALGATVFPLNVVTAIVGAPVVIAVLIRSRRGTLGAAL